MFLIFLIRLRNGILRRGKRARIGNAAEICHERPPVRHTAPSVTVRLIKPRQAAAGTSANVWFLSFYFLFISSASSQRRTLLGHYGMSATPQSGHGRKVSNWLLFYESNLTSPYSKTGTLPARGTNAIILNTVSPYITPPCTAGARLLGRRADKAAPMEQVTY